MKALKSIANRLFIILLALDQLICVVISLLFIGVELGSELSPLIAALFVCGMLSLIASLVCFLKEISLATWRLEAAFDADLRQGSPPPPDGQS